MFIGHFGLALAGKRAAPRPSLATWFVAVQFLDLLWPVFLLLGWEHLRISPGYTRLNPLDFYDYPFSHSLVAALSWSLAFAAVYRGVRGRGAGRSALWLGFGVLSHWLLDVLVHRPDLPVLRLGPYVGLGWWDRPVLAIGSELLLFGLGVVLYSRATQARDTAGRWGWWALVGALPAFWATTLVLPPPTDERQIPGFAMLMWLYVLWAWWVDRHREPRPPL